MGWVFSRKYCRKVMGKEYWIVNTDLYCMKIMELYKNKECNFHMHLNKKETFIGLKGSIDLFIENEGLVPLDSGHKYTLEPKTGHFFRGVDDVNVFIEVSTHHEDSDTVYLTKIGGQNNGNK